MAFTDEKEAVDLCLSFQELGRSLSEFITPDSFEAPSEWRAEFEREVRRGKILWFKLDPLTDDVLWDFNLKTNEWGTISRASALLS